MFEVKCKPIFFNFFYSVTPEAVFPASEDEFLSNAKFRRVETDYLLSVLFFRANVVSVETIIQIKMKPSFIEQTLSYYWKPFLTSFLNIPTGESSFSALWICIFLTKSLVLACAVRISVYRIPYLFFIYSFFLLAETIISSKIRLH